MTRFFCSSVFTAVLLVGAGALPVQAEGLTNNQIQQFLGMLSAFNVDSATIANVKNALGGTPTSNVIAPITSGGAAKVAGGITTTTNTSANTVRASAPSTGIEKDASILTAILNSQVAPTGGAFKSAVSTNQIKQEVQVAKQRGQLMMQLAEKDPSAFLRNAMPVAMRLKFPTEVQAEIEKKVTLVGKIEVIIIDDFTNYTNSRFEYFLQSGSARLPLNLAGIQPAMMSGSSVRVNGYQLGQTLVANGTPDGVLVVSEAVPESVGLQHVLAILITSSGYPQTPSPQEMKTKIFSGPFEKYYEEQSYGKVSFTGDVTDWISIAPYSGVCYGGSNTDVNFYTPQIHDYLIQHHIDLSQYDRLVFILNNDYGGCSGVGKFDAFFNSTTYRLSVSWVGWPNSGYIGGGTIPGFYDVLAHEIGHALGVRHANSWNCSGPSLDVNCYHSEYGNNYDVMGGGGAYSVDFNAFYKNLLGWFDNSSKISITKSGRYSLAPLEAQTGIRAAIVTNPAAPSVAPLYIEFRQPIGFDSNLPVLSAGLQLNQVIGAISQNPFTRLLNANYATSPSSQPSLMPGDNFVWGSRGISVGSLVTMPSTATIFDVGITQPQCDRIAFSKNDSYYPQVVVGTWGSYGFDITNNDTPACGPSTIKVSTTITNSDGWTISQDPSDPITLATGESRNIWASFQVPSDASLASRTIKVTISDTANGRSFVFERQLFIVAPPMITDIIPSSGKAGTVVTLKGTGFSNNNKINISAGNLSTNIFNVNANAGIVTFTFPTLLDNYDTGLQVPTPLGLYTVILVRDNDYGIATTNFTVTSDTSTTTTSTNPKIEFIGTPTLTLQYDSVGKETNLVGSAVVKVTAGNSPININSLPWILQFYRNGYGVADSNSMRFNATGSAIDTIPANTSATYTITNTVPTKELFAGEYTLSLSRFAYPNATIQPTSFANIFTNANGTIVGVNAVVIIGEVSPYLTSVNSDLAGNATINGVRLSASPGNSAVSFNGNTKSYSAFISSGGSDYINFKPSDFGVTTSGNYRVQVINSLVGNSNILWLSYTAPAPQPAHSCAPPTPLWGSYIASGSYITAYKSSSVISPATCDSVSQTSTCTNGTLSPASGVYTNQNCVVTTPVPQPAVSCTLPWGGTIESDNYVTAFKEPFVAGWLGFCMSEKRTCTNGSLSGSYGYKTCALFASALSAVEGLTQNSSASQSQTGFTYVWNNNLQIGSPYSSDIIALQTALTKEGVYAGEITGGFYNQTFTAVKVFQQKYGINATGFVGPKTRSELNSLYSK